MADELPSPSTTPAPDYNRRRTPQPTVTRRERPRSPYIPGSTVKRPRLEPAPRGTYKPPPKPVYKYKPVAKPKPVAIKPSPKPKPFAYQRRAANALLKRAGRTAATWVPKILLLGRYANPFYDLGDLIFRSVIRASDRGRVREYLDLDAALARALGRSAHPLHTVKIDQRVKVYHAPRPLTNSPLLQKINPPRVSAPNFPEFPQVLPPPKATPPGSRPSAPPRKTPFKPPKSPPKLFNSPFAFDFLNPSVGPQPLPQLALAPDYATGPQTPGPLTPFNGRGVRSAPGNQPGCRCPPEKKQKPLRPGRGFFVVSPSGLERRKYWLTGKDHTKEYRNARNTSRDFRRRSGKQLQPLRGVGV